MALVVHKYGGTSLATSARIRDVAARVRLEKRAANDVIVVVSAMGDTTDHLMALATDICERPDPRELDMLLTAGERISMSLVAMALNAAGLRSISLTGSQSGIITDGAHTRARILDVKGDRIRDGIADGRVVIVAGFQGVSAAREVTTLGRGGSDLTAVALASRFGALRCDIYTDVDGVYTADPGCVPTARRVLAIDHATMVAYSLLGAGVLHPRAARWAARHQVPVVVRSSFIPGPGTLVGAAAAPGPTLAGPQVIGLGCLRRVALLDLGAPADRVASVFDDEEESPFHLLVAGGRGAVGVLDQAAVEETVARAAGAGIEAAAPEHGDLLSVIHGAGAGAGSAAGAEMTGTLSRLVPTRVRSELLSGPHSTSVLVPPERTTDDLLALHRALIEAPAPTR
jgi:aspartate kinase